MKSLITAAIACAMMAMPTAFAANLGDPAAELALSEYIKGEPVNIADGKGKNIYVVEF